MRLAFYTYSYTDRLAMPLGPALETIAATGYDGIDISGTHGPSVDPRSVTSELRAQTRSTAERLGLTIEAVITHANLADSLLPTRRSTSRDRSIWPWMSAHRSSSSTWAGPKAILPSALKLGGGWSPISKTHLPTRCLATCSLAVDGVWAGWLADTPERFLELHDEVGSASFGVNFDPCYLTLLA